MISSAIRWWDVHLRFLPVFALLSRGISAQPLRIGDNYLFAPVIVEEKKAVSVDKAMVFADVIRPIFEKKCFSCHGAASMKGGLTLQDSIGITTGGKTGPFFIAGSPDSSLVMHRILLPADDKKHMPPVSKPSLADDEIAVLRAWIKSGGWMNRKLTNLPEKDSFRIAAAKFLEPSGKDLNQIVYDFPLRMIKRSML